MYHSVASRCLQEASKRVAHLGTGDLAMLESSRFLTDMEGPLEMADARLFAGAAEGRIRSDTSSTCCSSSPCCCGCSGACSPGYSETGIAGQSICSERILQQNETKRGQKRLPTGFAHVTALRLVVRFSCGEFVFSLPRNVAAPFRARTTETPPSLGKKKTHFSHVEAPQRSSEEE